MAFNKVCIVYSIETIMNRTQSLNLFTCCYFSNYFYCLRNFADMIPIFDTVRYSFHNGFCGEQIVDINGFIANDLQTR